MDKPKSFPYAMVLLPSAKCDSPEGSQHLSNLCTALTNICGGCTLITELSATGLWAQTRGGPQISDNHYILLIALSKKWHMDALRDLISETASALAEHSICIITDEIEFVEALQQIATPATAV